MTESEKIVTLEISFIFLQYIKELHQKKFCDIFALKMHLYVFDHIVFFSRFYRNALYLFSIIGNMYQGIYTKRQGKVHQNFFLKFWFTYLQKRKSKTKKSENIHNIFSNFPYTLIFPVWKIKERQIQ